jgi:hypothetical protein
MAMKNRFVGLRDKWPKWRSQQPQHRLMLLAQTPLGYAKPEFGLIGSYRARVRQLCRIGLEQTEQK